MYPTYPTYPTYEERASALAGAVVWAKSPAPGAAAAAVRPVLPDGCMDLLWTPGRLFVAGPDTRAQLPQGGPGDRFAGIRFAPGTAPAVLGVPAYELRDRRVELADLWGAARARRLTERVDAAADPVAALESVALETAERRAADGVRPDPLLTRVVRLLDGGAPVAAAADEVGLGARTLHRRAQAAFGYGPKTLARVLRLQRALALVGRGAPYASAAVSAGYADQAHFTREMRALSGMTPSGYGAGGAPA
ncbi:helix-turn-helix transcriptional regulator [Streptomyces tsukubensis]|uniref:AraC family transcriptional regulator n=2 Tax=Streptomyces tsukubensis TaxID=83656 RepID=A0A7G3UB59_STRT9|nr:AraC family transcriptional regulator [Streptomyces tsukubensis]AZK97243.1 AraC family transcriptional regulator [Streptomyces tsukubensis]QKM66791.1 AraC family transcriptional regulator [Streptomyces tsukubensis NRRL18488]TAI44862.1 AraC family transcriptional regulator [Streptomyces tsukubensis]